MLQDSLSAALLQTLFERSKQFIGLLDPSTNRFVRVNPAGAALFGYAGADEFLQEFTHSAANDYFTKDRLAGLLKSLADTGQFSDEVSFVRNDGTSFWGQLQIDQTVVNAQTCYLIQITDINRTRSIERQLEHSARRYQAVFTYATIGIIVVDSQGKIVSVSQHVQTQFGYREEEMIGRPIEILLPHAITHRHEQLRRSFNENPQVRAMGHGRDLFAKKKDDSVFPAEISLSYFYEDEELYAVAYIIDISYKKQAERELIEQKSKIEQLNVELEQKVADRTHALMATLHQLEQSKEELTKALAAERELGELKSRFVSMASHEFRTPLSAVLTSASLIEKYPDSDQQEKRQKHIQRIKSSVNHLNDILEEFLSVGKLEEGKIEANWSPVDINAVVNEVVADLQEALKAGQSVRISLDCPRPVRLDKSLLRKVLVNLLSNASKYSGENSPIELSGTCRGPSTQIQIRDYGIGISEEDQKHLFERFFRAKNAVNLQGTGLGLHIVAKYLELLDGRIELHSQLNEGTTVTLTFSHENHSAH